MPIIRDNNIQNDSPAMRLTRLSAIQNERLRTTALLPLIDPSIAVWMKRCFISYSEILSELAAVREKEQASAEALNQSLEQLREGFNSLRAYLATNTANAEGTLSAYAQGTELLEDPDQLLHFARQIVQMHDEKGADLRDDVAHHLLDNVARLLGDYFACRDTHHTHAAELEKILAREQQQRRLDARMLKKLHLYWISEKSDRHPDISLIGMINLPSHDYENELDPPRLIFDETDRVFMVEFDHETTSKLVLEIACRQEHGQDWEEYYNGDWQPISLNESALKRGVTYDFSARCVSTDRLVLSSWSGIVRVSTSPFAPEEAP